MKRKRGRPKGSTKKPSGEEELAESVVSPQEGSPPAPEEGSSLAPGSLECGQCRRKFSNPRQLRKHVCIIVLNWGEEDGDAGTLPKGRTRQFLAKTCNCGQPFALVQLLHGDRALLYAAYLSGKVCVWEPMTVTVGDVSGRRCPRSASHGGMSAGALGSAERVKHSVPSVSLRPG